MDTDTGFDQTVEAIAAKRREDDPVNYAKRELAPVRADAELAITEFDREAQLYAPVFAAALEKFERAARARIVYRELQNYVSQGYELMRGGRVALQDVINRIDNLDAYGVYQRWHLGYPGLLRLRRANIGAIASMAHTVEWHVRVLEEWVAESAPARLAASNDGEATS